MPKLRNHPTPGVDYDNNSQPSLKLCLSKHQIFQKASDPADSVVGNKQVSAGIHYYMTGTVLHLEDGIRFPGLIINNSERRTAHDGDKGFLIYIIYGNPSWNR